MIWNLRIAIARWLLGAGPSGFDFYFKDQKLFVRRTRTYSDIVENIYEY